MMRPATHPDLVLRSVDKAVALAEVVLHRRLVVDLRDDAVEAGVAKDVAYQLINNDIDKFINITLERKNEIILLDVKPTDMTILRSS